MGGLKVLKKLLSLIIVIILINSFYALAIEYNLEYDDNGNLIYQVSGNLLKNPSFEIDDGFDFDKNWDYDDKISSNNQPDGWYSNGHNASGGSFSYTKDCSISYSGSCSMKQTSNNAKVWTLQDIPIENGESYEVSGWVKTDLSSGNGSIISECIDINHNHIWNTSCDLWHRPLEQYLNGVNNWTKISFTVNASYPGAAYLRVICYTTPIENTQGPPYGTGTIWCDEIKVRKISESDINLYQYYIYNSNNQLVKVYTQDTISEYFYDTEGNRIKKIEIDGGSNSTTYYIDKNFIRIVNGSGSFDTVYYYDENDLVGKKENNKLYFYHPDHLGSTSIVTNESAGIIKETNYLPYGEVLEGGEDRFLFTGKEKDKETGLYYYGARFYDPFLKHFTQPDTLIQDIYNPQDLNRYSYVRNNPYKYVDLSGKFAFIPPLIIAAYYGVTYGLEPLVSAMASEAHIMIPLMMEAYREEGVKGVVVVAALPGIGKIGGEVVGKLGSELLSKTKFGQRYLGKSIGISVSESRTISFTEKQLQSKFKHAPDFGIKGDYNKYNVARFKQEIESFVSSSDTQVIEGTYRGTIKGTHYYDPKTNLWTFKDSHGEFVSGWKLSPAQVRNLLINKDVR